MPILPFLIGSVVLAIVAIILVVGTIAVCRVLLRDDLQKHPQEDQKPAQPVKEAVPNNSKEDLGRDVSLKRDESLLEVKETSFMNPSTTMLAA